MNFNAIARVLIKFEPIILLIIGVAYWFPSPTRDSWIWLIVLALFPLAARLYLYPRFWSTNFYDLFATFFVLTMINIFAAPYESRGLILIFRPLFGLILFVYCVGYVRIYGNLTRLIQVTLFALLVIGIFGLTAITNWTNKSEQFEGIINLLPRLTSPLWEGGFNPNELAGVTTWLMPLAVAVLAYQRPRGKTEVLAGVALVVAGIALVIGQSFSGMVGVAAGILLVLTPRKARAAVAVVMGLAIVVIQLCILIAPSASVQVAMDVIGRTNVRSLEHRAEMWTSAQQILYDYPFTGVGLAMYRQPIIRQRYPTPNFDPLDAVHPHNEVFQVATDLGLPGLVIFVAWYVTAFGMVLRVERFGNDATRTLALGLAGGLVAHIVYGLGDAIPLWDRFAFVGWWMLGLVAAIHAMVPQPDSSR